MQTIQTKLDAIKASGNFRTLEIPFGFDFSSNDYLGLSQNETIKKKLADFLLSDKAALGSTGSRLISGENHFFQTTETFIAELYQAESALIFGSGYQANVGVMVALGGADTEFFSDELNHASLIDGIKLSKSPVKVFKHNDLNALANLLSDSTARRKVIVTESVFSMDGDLVNTTDLVALAKKYNAFLVLDEAHATGVIGKLGLGEAHNFHANYEKLISVHTCSKALGTYGAFVISNQPIRELMINCARSFIYATALPPVIVLNIRYSLEELLKNSSLVEQLQSNTLYLKVKLKLNQSGSNIVPYIIGNETKVMQVASNLQAKGFYVRGIRFPTVARGSERLRITVKAFHTKELLNAFATNLNEALHE